MSVTAYRNITRHFPEGSNVQSSWCCEQSAGDKIWNEERERNKRLEDTASWVAADLFSWPNIVKGTKYKCVRLQFMQHA